MAKKNIPEAEAAKALLAGEEQNNAENVGQNGNTETKDLGLGVVKTDEVKNAEQSKEFAKEAATIGYVDVFPNKFPSEGKYCPADWKFKVRAASFEEIKDYSSMREEDIYDVDEHVQRIMDASLEITRGKQGRGSYKDLSQTDKIFAIFAIRDRSMIVHQREKKIYQTVECPYDGHKNKIEINNDIFNYYKIPKGITKWYDDVERCFIIQDEVIGQTPLKIYIPTVGVIEHISEFIKYKNAQKQASDGGYYNQHHLDMASFLIKDWRDLDPEFSVLGNIMHQIKDVWNYDRYQLMSKAVDKINYGIKPTITIRCGKTGCGKEVSAPARFQGFKSLFDFSNRSEELLSDTE